MSEKSSEFHQRNSSKIPEKSNFQNFIASSRYIPIPTFLTSLVQEGILTHAQFSATFHLFNYCYFKNKTSVMLSHSELAKVMFCSQTQAKTTVKILKANKVLFCEREKLNALNEYSWNSKLWINSEATVKIRPTDSQNSTDGQSKFDRRTVKIRPSSYIEEFLLKYLIIISLNNVRSAWRSRVEKFPELLRDNEDGLIRPVTLFLDQKVAAWEAAVTEALKTVPSYLLILFFKHQNFDPTTISDPTKYLTVCFSDHSTTHELNKRYSFMFQNSEEFFGLYGEEMQSELNAGGFQ